MRARTSLLAILFGALGAGCTFVSGLAEYEKCSADCGDAASSAPDAGADAEPAPKDISGTYLASCRIGASEAVRAWVDLKVNVAGRTVDYDATWLKTGGRFSRADTTGAALKKPGLPIRNGRFTVVYGDTSIPGEANLLSSTSVATKGLTIEILASSPPCGELSGAITAPLTVDLTAAGDICILRALKEGDAIPTYPGTDYHCP